MPKRNKSSKKRALQARREGFGPSDPQFRGPTQYTAVVVCGFLLLAVAIVFGQTVHHAFIKFDDPQYVYENPHVISGLTAEGIAWAFTTSHASNWHPLTWLSHMLDCQIYGLAPGGHHLTNALLHAATTILLFLVLRRITGEFWPSAFVAAVFAIHPLRVESVAWVSERKDILSGLFFMLTLWAYVNYVRHSFSITRYLAVIVLFALGLMAKPMLVTLPFVLLLLDYWPLGRMMSSTAENRPYSGSWQSERFSIFMRLVMEKVPLLVLAGVSCSITLWAQSKAIAAANEHVSLSLRIGNAAVSYVAYLGQFFYPVGLAVLYPHPGLGLPMWKVAAAILVLMALSGGVIALRRQCPYLLVGWLWYLGMLVPVIGLIQVGLQAMADRYTYLPQIGLSIALTWGVMYIVRSWPYRRWACGIASVLVVTALLGCAWRQTTFWYDGGTLWAHALACTSQNYVAENNLGVILLDSGQVQKAMACIERSLQINPNNAETENNMGSVLVESGRLKEAIEHYQQALRLKPEYPDGHYNLGIALVKAGSLKEAIKQFQEALRLNPDYYEALYNIGFTMEKLGQPNEAIKYYQQALRLNPNYPDAQKNLGISLLNAGRLQEAIEYYQQVLRIKSDFTEVRNNLGLALADAGRLQEAIEQFQLAIRLKPDYINSYNNLGNTLAKANKPQEAIEQFQQAIRLKPDYINSYNNLGNTLAKINKPQEAIEQFQQALRLKPDFTEAYFNLALAYATMHQSSEAITSAKKALELARSQGQTSQAKQIEDWLNSYRASPPEPSVTPPTYKIKN
jgi:protein O-mannosyl-transferase